MSETKEELFDSKFLKKLEMLNILSRRLFAGATRGERRSTHRGLSVEFADYREYSDGDDLRYVDWNAVARLNHFFLKLFVEEEDLFVYIILDATKSMGFGAPEKLTYAKRIAAALAYIALANLDRVAVEVLSGPEGDAPAAPGAEQRLAATRGKQNIFKVFDFLKHVTAGGAAALSDSLERFAARNSKPGLAIIMSDLMDPKGLSKGVDFLRYRKFQPVVIHILSPEEIEPGQSGDWRLVDSETGGHVDISMTKAVLDSYRKRLNAFLDYTETFCKRRSIPYLRAVSSTPFEDLMLRYLRQASVVA
jgi:uncharacterized protein (DUF58 family)